MDPYTLAYLAGHSDFSITKRYVHPQEDTVLAAMERVHRVSGGHNFGHRSQDASDEGGTSPEASTRDFYNDRSET